ncbi:hypothetical protein MUP77_18950 [Candidatus Bathyarchaeota archaeon]|nr:hypothetical protein [Candidatus Bathyarchaeota archaeon]
MQATVRDRCEAEIISMERNDIEFIFNLSLAIFSVSMPFSAYLAQTVARVFYPGMLIYYWNWRNPVYWSSWLYSILLLSTIYIFAFCWYKREELWRTRIIGAYSRPRFAKFIHVNFGLMLGLLPWLVYYIALRLKELGVIQGLAG